MNYVCHQPVSVTTDLRQKKGKIKMLIEVKQWPESQEVTDDAEWFPIVARNSEKDPLGPSANARVLHDEEFARYLGKKIAHHLCVHCIIRLEDIEREQKKGTK